MAGPRGETSGCRGACPHAQTAAEDSRRYTVAGRACLSIVNDYLPRRFARFKLRADLLDF